VSAAGVAGMTIIAIPSLAPPGYHRWFRWADAHFEEVADAALAALAP
jgi:hypothetical protein